ncbi:MAG: hypothetical protein ACJ8EF_02610 [Bradyrhizobium sp.]
MSRNKGSESLKIVFCGLAIRMIGNVPVRASDEYEWHPVDQSDAVT